MFNLGKRDRQPELMDQPGLDAGLHQQALAGLRRVNRLSRTADILFREILDLGKRHRGQPLRVLDVAAGGGDVTLQVAELAKKRGLPLHIEGCDISPTAVKLAQRGAELAGFSQVRFFEHDVLRGELPTGFDVVMCTLFLHHLEEQDTVRVLQRMRAAAARLVLVDDLLRTTWGFLLAWCGSRLLTRSPIVHVDGPLSVRAAYTEQEMRQLALQAGLEQPRFRRHWPQRFLMRWNNPNDREG